MKGSSRATLVGAVALAVAVAVPTAANAVPEPSAPIVTGLAGPLQLDVGADGQIYVGQAFAGVLTKVRPNGTTKDLTAEPGEIAGVASRGYDVVYTTSGGTEEEPFSLLKKRSANGTVRTIADLGAYEAKHNPDAGNRYGFRQPGEACAAQVPPRSVADPYTGIIESHPYAVANAPGGGWYVADAAGNAILKVSKKGKVSTYFVLRPQKAVVTAEAAGLFGLPDCAIGATYAFEPVPTDVEVLPNGSLIVSMLPGGPEDASLGARGGIIRIAGDGEFANLASGFLGATNVAIGKGGRIYVAELFANRISVLRNGVVTPVADLPSPAGVEYVERHAVREHRCVRQRLDRHDRRAVASRSRSPRGVAGSSGGPSGLCRPEVGSDLRLRRGRRGSAGSGRWSRRRGRGRGCPPPPARR